MLDAWLGVGVADLGRVVGGCRECCGGLRKREKRSGEVVECGKRGLGAVVEMGAAACMGCWRLDERGEKIREENRVKNNYEKVYIYKV